MFSPLLLLLCLPLAAEAQEKAIRLGPILQVEWDEEEDVRLVEFAGPIFSYRQDDGVKKWALRPIFFWGSESAEGRVKASPVFPFISYRRSSVQEKFHFIQLVSYSSNELKGEESARRFQIFPFLISGNTHEAERYFALLPAGGHLKNFMGADEVDLVLPPVFVRTSRHENQVVHLLWPFFSFPSGESMHGWKFWPIASSREFEGKWKRSFFLWPLFVRTETGLDTENPVSASVMFPFYAQSLSPNRVTRSYFSLFFLTRDTGESPFTSWGFPWPLMQVTRGEDRHTTRFFPLFGTRTVGAKHSEYFLWLLYSKIEHMGETQQSSHVRLGAIFYDHLRRRDLQAETEETRTVVWPLFSFNRPAPETYRFSFPAPFESLLPAHDRLVSTYSPFWTLLSVDRRPDQGRRVSFLWKVFDHELKGESRRWNLLGPVLAYQAEGNQEKKFSFLGGFLGYHREGSQKSLRFLFIPLHLGGAESPDPASEPARDVEEG